MSRFSEGVDTVRDLTEKTISHASDSILHDAEKSVKSDISKEFKSVHAPLRVHAFSTSFLVQNMTVTRCRQVQLLYESCCCTYTIFRPYSLIVFVCSTAITCGT